VAANSSEIVRFAVLVDSCDQGPGLEPDRDDTRVSHKEKRMKIFDSMAFFGPYHRQDLDASPETVLGLMDELSAGRALAVSLFAIEHDMFEGNERVLELARAHPERLEPVAVVTPGQCLPGRGMMGRLREQGFRIVAFLPEMQGWPLELLSFRSAAREAADAGMPIMLAVGKYGSASLAARALEGLQTPVVVRSHTGGGYLLPDEFIAVGREFPNFYFDVWNLVGAGQIRLLAQELGANRLVYGSGLPLCCGRSSQFLLRTAGLDEEAMRWVLGGTLCSILGDERPSGLSDELATHPSISRPKIDIHYHLGEWNLLCGNTTAEEVVTDLDTFALQYCLMSSSAALRASAAQGNAVVADALGTDPRMKGYVYLDPYHPEESAQDLERYAQNEGFVGVKTRPDFHGTTLEHPAYLPLLKRAAELKMPLLTHGCAVEFAAERVPELSIIVAHSASGTAKTLADFPNVFFCTASSTPFMHGEEIRKMIDAAGTDRVLFGSDGPLISPAWNLGRFASAQLAAEEEEKIFAANANRVFPRLGAPS